ncbi:hypothetical protein DERA104750_12395 [Deinococcus radiodurans]|nr:hypothetical protein DRO_1717 [Deinococcus radiodurans R1 = ATCC 13939 = DSM 20539]
MKGELGSVPSQVSQALRRATALLPCGVREDVTAELLANLWQTRLDAELRGLDEAAAWDTALSDLGPPWHLALGLARVHLLAPLRRWLLVGVALGGAAYAVQTQTPHQVPHTDIVQEAPR